MKSMISLYPYYPPVISSKTPRNSYFISEYLFRVLMR